MKDRHLSLIFLSILLSVVCNVFSQSDNSFTTGYEEIAQSKYWYLRNRLDLFRLKSEDPFNTEGSYLIMKNRNYNYKENPRKFTGLAGFGQQMGVFGKYLGVLATEYWLLEQEGYHNEALETKAELNNALTAFDRLDYFDNNIDGRFIRSDTEDNISMTETQIAAFNNSDIYLISADPLHVRNGNSYKVREVNKWGPNTIEWLSQDEAIFLLEGLVLAAELVNSSHAKYILNRLIHFIYEPMPIIPFFNWTITKPSGHRVEKGADCQGFSYGFYTVKSHIPVAPPLDPNNFIVPHPGFASLSIWFSYEALLNLSWYDWHDQEAKDANHMYLSLEALGNVHDHFLATRNSLEAIKTIGDHYDWTSFYSLLNTTLYPNIISDQSTIFNIESTVTKIPKVGPWWHDFLNHSTLGWAAENKWYNHLASQFGQEPDSMDVGIYSGIDAMLLINLLQISSKIGHIDAPNYKFDEKFFYKPFQVNVSTSFPTSNNNAGTLNNPCNVLSFDLICSDATIGSNAGQAHVNYVARESITLTPGFSVSSGSTFNAIIEEDWYVHIPEYFSNKPQLVQKMESIETLQSEIPELESFVTIYPNPTSDFVAIQSGLDGEIIVSNILGEKILSGIHIYKHQNNMIDVSGLSQGTYIITILSEGKPNTSKKLVIQ